MKTKIILQGINESIEQLELRINNLLQHHKGKINNTTFSIQNNLLICIIEINN